MSTAMTRYRGVVSTMTQRALGEMLGEKKGRKVAARFDLAFRGAAASNPGLYEADPASVAEALAFCLLSGFLPGGHVPDVYLFTRRIKNVQRAQVMVAPSGLRKMAQRCGFGLTAIPVFDGDEAEAKARVQTIAEGGVYVPEPVNRPREFEALVGCYVVVQNNETGRNVAVDFMPRVEIEKRRACSDSYRRSGEDSVWGQWPVEMALKTVLHYAIRRGLVPLDEQASRFLSKVDADDASDVVDVAPVPQLTLPDPVPSRSADVVRAALAQPAADVVDQDSGPDLIHSQPEVEDDGQMPLS